MIGLFFGIIWAGATYLTLMVIGLQLLVFRELVNVSAHPRVCTVTIAIAMALFVCVTAVVKHFHYYVHCFLPHCRHHHCYTPPRP
jgi:hypothetical protein